MAQFFHWHRSWLRRFGNERPCFGYIEVCLEHILGWSWKMRKLLRALSWVVKHLFIKSTDLNNGEGKPHTAIVVGIEGEF